MTGIHPPSFTHQKAQRGKVSADVGSSGSGSGGGSGSAVGGGGGGGSSLSASEATLLSQEEYLLITNRLHQVGQGGHRAAVFVTWVLVGIEGGDQLFGVCVCVCVTVALAVAPQQMR